MELLRASLPRADLNLSSTKCPPNVTSSSSLSYDGFVGLAQDEVVEPVNSCAWTKH